MTSPSGPPERGARDDAASGPDAPATHDPAELAEGIRTGRVPIVPGSLVELVMRSGSDATDADPPIAAPPPSAPDSPVHEDRPRPTGVTGGVPVDTLEDADLGDLGDDPLGVGPLDTSTDPPTVGQRTGTPGGHDDDTHPPAMDRPPSEARGPERSEGAMDPGAATPPTAPGDVVPAPISPTPAPVPEPETGPNHEAAARDPEHAPGEPDDEGVAVPDPQRWPLFGGHRPPSDGPATDVLPGMAFGRVAGRYPSADPVTSTGRTTMPGRRRPDPAPESGPPPTARPTMPGPPGSRPPAAEQPPATTPPPLSAPPPSLAPEPPARPTADRRRPESDDPAAATTDIIPAVTDEPPADGPRETGAWDAPRIRNGRTPGPVGREADPWDPAVADAVAPDPASTRRNGHPRAPRPSARGASAPPAEAPPVPGTRVRGNRTEPDGPGPAVAETPAGSGAHGTTTGRATAPDRSADPAVTSTAVGAATAETAAATTTGATTTGATTAGPTTARPAEDTEEAGAPQAKKATPPREAIMSAGPRNGRGVSAGGLAIALAAILLAVLTVWAIAAPSTPDTSSNGAGQQARSAAAQQLRPVPVQAAASRPDPSGRATVPAAGAPQDVAVSPGGRFAYVAVQEPPRLVVLDAGTDVTTAEIPLPGPPRFVAMAPDGARAYVSMSDQDNAVNLLGVVDVVGNRLASTIPVGADPARAVPSPDGRFVYLASRGEARIDEIDPNAGVVTRSVPVARDPFAVAPFPDGDRLIAVNRGSGQMTVLDPNTLSVLANHPVSGDAQAVAVSPTAPQVAVAGPDTDLVAILDPGSGREIATVRVRTGPTALAFAPDGRHLYVAAGDAVRVVDTASWEDVGTVPTGPGASSVAVSPDGRTAWVTNGRAGSVSVLNLA